MPLRTPLPGFGLSLGYSMLYLTLMVLIPLAALVFKTTSLHWSEFFAIVTTQRALHSLGMSFGGAFIAAIINALMGTIIAWTLVRTTFPGSRLLDALVDLPFAIPTAVAGIALTAVWGPNGVLGHTCFNIGVKTAYSRLGIIIAMVFVGMPFIVRTVQPVIETMKPEVEEAARTLGSSDFQIFFKITLPHISPAIVTGFALGFARALGEYGSIVFISGNMPMKTEITPLLIMTKLEQFDTTGATALSTVMLAASMVILIGINSLDRRNKKRGKSHV